MLCLLFIRTHFYTFHLFLYFTLRKCISVILSFFFENFKTEVGYSNLNLGKATFKVGNSITLVGTFNFKVGIANFFLANSSFNLANNNFYLFNRAHCVSNGQAIVAVHDSGCRLNNC